MEFVCFTWGDINKEKLTISSETEQEYSANKLENTSSLYAHM